MKKKTIEKICHLLDQEQIKYLSIIHSQSYTEEEMAIDDYNLGNELVDSVLIRMDHEEMMMLIVPSTRKISLASLQKELNTTNITFIGKKEIQLLFPDYEAGTLPPIPIGSLSNIPVYCMAELKKMQEVTFYLGTRFYRIRMKTADFFKVVKPKVYIGAVTTPRYQAEINTVVPINKKNILNQYQSCILGISLENKNFITAKLVGMIDWVSRNFQSCIVIIGDSIHHHTLEIKGMDKSYAYDKALCLGRELIDINNCVFQSYAEYCDINIVLCSEIQTTIDYYKHYAELRILFNKNQHFALCLRTFAETFVERRADTDEHYHDESIEKSCTYLLEELAVFACLSEQGYKVFVYPGALRVLTEIASEIHPDAPQALKELINVELKIKRRGST